MVTRIVNRIKDYLYRPKYNRLCSEAQERLRLNAFLPGVDSIDVAAKDTDKASNDGSGKTIRVAILHQEIYMYNMIHSLYNEFSKSDDIECDIIISSNKLGGMQYRECADSLRQKNIPFKYDFDCTEEKYDVLIVICFHVPPSKYQEKIRKNSRYCLAMPSNEYKPTFLIVQKNNLMTWRPDGVVCEKWQADACKDAFDIPLYATGNVKYDILFEACNSDAFGLPGNFKKLTGSSFKKTFLYITDHNGNNKTVSPYVSFDLYAKKIFSFFEEHKDCCLIFRPYRTYIDENVMHGVWTSEEVSKFQEYCRSHDNIVWDDEDHDSISISLADAVISDVTCGIATHALPVLKPIGIPLRWDMNCDFLIEDKKEKEKCYYYIRSEDDMESFFQMVLNEENPKLDEMKRLYARAISYFDGENAKRIKEIIEKEYSS